MLKIKRDVCERGSQVGSAQTTTIRIELHQKRKKYNAPATIKLLNHELRIAILGPQTSPSNLALE